MDIINTMTLKLHRTTYVSALFIFYINWLTIAQILTHILNPQLYAHMVMEILYIHFLPFLGYATVLHFPLSLGLIELNGKGQLMNLSCHDRCVGADEMMKNQLPSHADCNCDPYCIFFGDCCYDYLLQCKSDLYNLDSVLKEQFQFYQRFSKHTSCRRVDSPEHPFGESIHVVDRCPAKMDNSTHAALCKAEVGFRTLASLMLVITNNVIFLNSYCAACHGILMHEIEMISEEYGIQCYTPQSNICPWTHLCQNLECPHAKVNINQKYNRLFDRARIHCICDTFFFHTKTVLVKTMIMNAKPTRQYMINMLLRKAKPVLHACKNTLLALNSQTFPLTNQIMMLANQTMTCSSNCLNLRNQLTPVIHALCYMMSGTWGISALWKRVKWGMSFTAINIFHLMNMPLVLPLMKTTIIANTT